MRSTAATFEAGFDLPARKKGARGRRPTKTGKQKQQKRFPLQAIARYAAIGAGITIACGIMVNALVLQKGHHPAPLFGKSTIFRQAVAAGDAPGKTVPAPHANPQPTPVPPPPAPPSARKQPAQSDTSREARPADDDPIARLLRRSGQTPSAGEKVGNRAISGAQKALTKLGFTVRASGTMNAATRKALEAFQKAHHLPSKGELDHRSVKLLAAESGMHID